MRIPASKLKNLRRMAEHGQRMAYVIQQSPMVRQAEQITHSVNPMVREAEQISHAVQPMVREAEHISHKVHQFHVQQFPDGWHGKVTYTQQLPFDETLSCNDQGVNGSDIPNVVHEKRWTLRRIDPSDENGSYTLIAYGVDGTLQAMTEEFSIEDAVLAIAEVLCENRDEDEC